MYYSRRIQHRAGRQLVMYGAIGLVAFECSSKKVLTFQRLSRSLEARYSVHEPLGKRPVPEYIGPGQQKATLAIRLDVSLGTNPKRELSRLYEMVKMAKAWPLIVGSDYIGSYYITGLSEDRLTHDGLGNLFRADVSLELLQGV